VDSEPKHVLGRLRIQEDDPQRASLAVRIPGPQVGVSRAQLHADGGWVWESVPDGGVAGTCMQARRAPGFPVGAGVAVDEQSVQVEHGHEDEREGACRLCRMTASTLARVSPTPSAGLMRWTSSRRPGKIRCRIDAGGGDA